MNIKSNVSLAYFFRSCNVRNIAFFFLLLELLNLLRHISLNLNIQAQETSFSFLLAANLLEKNMRSKKEDINHNYCNNRNSITQITNREENNNSKNYRFNNLQAFALLSEGANQINIFPSFGDSVNFYAKNAAPFLIVILK